LQHVAADGASPGERQVSNADSIGRRNILNST